MIALIQRVSRAKVTVKEKEIGKIGKGLLVLLGVEQNDNLETMQKLADKVIKYRIFSDENGKMNINVKDINGALLVVSQFTLAADTSKGLRPSFSGAGTPEMANSLYEAFINYCRQQSITVETGQFAADMQVELVNDGPVTFELKV